MFTLNVARLIKTLAGLLVCLAALTLLLRLTPLPEFPGDALLSFFTEFVDVSAERSLFTWLSCLLWLSAAATAALVGLKRRETGRPDSSWWQAFALVPLAISIDEVAAMHERLSRIVRGLLDLGGALYFAWVIPVGLLAVLLAVVFFRFYLRLPSWLRVRVTVAAALAAGGALGLELVGSSIDQAEGLGRGSAAYLLVSVLEETLEYSGALVLLHALLHYLALQGGRLALHVQRAPGLSTEEASRQKLVGSWLHAPEQKGASSSEA